eukprot:m.294576 g.294576  ORF g.294576 m.294576 type:complete len:87 (+) comp47057_c0_seq1:707-967(+)
MKALARGLRRCIGKKKYESKSTALIQANGFEGVGTSLQLAVLSSSVVVLRCTRLSCTCPSRTDSAMQFWFLLVLDSKEKSCKHTQQ